MVPVMLERLLDPGTLVLLIPITAIIAGHFRRMAKMRYQQGILIKQNQRDEKLEQLGKDINELRERLNQVILTIDDVANHQKRYQNPCESSSYSKQQN